MKNTLVLFAIAGLAALGLSSYSNFQEKEKAQPKKTRHIKMMKMENGKKMELDTVLSGDDVFVWNGDTINPQKHIKKFSPSEFDKIHHPDGDMDEQRDVKIYRHKGNKSGKPMIWKMDSDDDVETVTVEEGDSTENKIIIRKRLKDGNDEDQIIYFNHEDEENFPPMPPMPPMPHMRMMQMNHSKGMINLNDPNVISYKKKVMSGGREKIEIIRYKSDENENMNFNIEMDDSMIAPGAPQPEGFKYEFKTGEPKERKIRKEMRIDKKNQTETEEEVAPDATK